MMMQQHETTERLAGTHRLKRATELPSPRPGPAEDQAQKVEYVDETPKRPRRTELEARTEDELGHQWVTVLAYDRPMPMRMGDQHGMLPVWVEATSDWRRAGYDANKFTPAARIVRLIVVGVPSAEHAIRLKGALDEALKGREAAGESEELRYRFRNGVDFGAPDLWLTELLADAMRLCAEEAKSFEAFSRADHDRMVQNGVARIGGKTVYFDPGRRGGCA